MTDANILKSAWSRMMASIIAIVLVTATGLIGENNKPVSGETRIVKLLGLEEHYDRLFREASQADGTLFSGKAYGAFAVASTGAATNPATGEAAITFQWDPTHQYRIYYSWVPQNASVKRLTKQQVIDYCGKPNKADNNTVTYGRVKLAFGAKGQVAKVTIYYQR